MTVNLGASALYHIYVSSDGHLFCLVRPDGKLGGIFFASRL